MLDAEDYFVAAQAERKERELRAKFQGRYVTLTRGKYEGRRGYIDGVTLNVNKGRWEFLIYVLRVHEPDEPLNLDGASRSYHPTWDFRLEEGRYKLPSSRKGKHGSLHDIWFGEG